MNLYDLGITFGYVTNSGPGVGALNLLIEEALVTMSYGEAKFLAQVLSRHIEAYEKAFGPVATQDLPQATVDGLEQTVASLRANNLRPG